MYNNVLLLLEAIKEKRYIQYTDYNVSEYHLNEFYTKHYNQKDIMIIKLFFNSLNYESKLEKMNDLKI